MAVGMAAIPQEAHQAGRHMDRPHAVNEPHVGDGRADDGPARPSLLHERARHGIVAASVSRRLLFPL